MSEHFALAVVLLNAVAYTGSALSLKSALGRGVNAWQVSAWCNGTMAVLYLPFWLGADGPALAAHWFQPLVVAVIFLLGQLFTFAALQRGDVSVATPLLGAKVVFVPLVAAGLFYEVIANRWWVAAAFSAAGVVVVTRAVPRVPVAPGGSSARHGAGSVWPTAACSLGAAGCFALSDVLFQHWSGPVGLAGFIALMYSGLGVLTAVLYLPRFGRGLLRLPTDPTGRRALGLGCLLQAGQNLSMSLVLSFYGRATTVNVVYSSRCLWSVVLAWAVARWIGGAEARLPRDLLWARLGGAALLFTALCLVVLPG